MNITNLKSIVGTSNLIKIGIISLLFALFIIVISTKEYDNFKLRKEGLYLKAVVIKKRTVGAKGTIYTYYRYNVDGIYYEDYSTVDDFAKIGDSITIIYLKSDPKISRTNTFLNTNCP
jgi:hypothetical protein